jgi:hypothetical protein
MGAEGHSHDDKHSTKTEMEGVLYLEPDRAAIREAWESVGSDEKPKVFQIVQGLRNDISDFAVERLRKLPFEEIPERVLFPIVEQLFRRPAFYTHKERSWDFALYAIVKTRIVWEQEVIPRLRSAIRFHAAEVTRQLLELEDIHASTLGISPEELTEHTAKFLGDKGIFLYFLPQRRRLSIEEMLEKERARFSALRQLGMLLENCGINVPDIGMYEVMGRPGDE